MAKYALFICSMLETRYKWFHTDLCQSKKIDLLMIEKGDLETMIGFFRTACVKNGLKKAVVVNFLEFLSAHQD